MTGTLLSWLIQSIGVFSTSKYAVGNPWVLHQCLTVSIVYPLLSMGSPHAVCHTAGNRPPEWSLSHTAPRGEGEEEGDREGVLSICLTVGPAQQGSDCSIFVYPWTLQKFPICIHINTWESFRNKI